MAVFFSTSSYPDDRSPYNGPPAGPERPQRSKIVLALFLLTVCIAAVLLIMFVVPDIARAASSAGGCGGG